MEQKELRGLEDRCIQEYAPPCTAACPIHVDVRGMMSEITRGDLVAALKIVRKTLLFPGIVGRICEQPCRTVCNRKHAGGHWPLRRWSGPRPILALTIPRRHPPCRERTGERPW